MPRIIDLSQLQQFAAVNNPDADLGELKGPVIVPNAVQVVLRWTLDDGKIAHNVLYAGYSPPFALTSTDAQAIFSGLTTGALWTAFASHIFSTNALAAVDLRNVDVKDQPIISSTGLAVPGTNVSGPLPNEVALVVTLRTAKTGKANRGRMYVPGYGGNAVGANNVVAGPTVTDTQAWAQSITAVLSGRSLIWGLGQKERLQYTSPITGTTHPARPAHLEPITQAVVKDNHWDSQRRRGLK